MSQPGQPSGREVLLVARWPVGGIRTHLGYNWRALQQGGCRFTLVVPEDASLPPLKERLGEGSPTFVPVRTRGRQCALWRAVAGQMASRRFDVVHAHGMTAAGNAALGGLLSSTPLVVTLHEPLRDEQFRGAMGAFRRWAAGAALSRASAVITVSHDARENLYRYFPALRRRKTVHTIPNGIDAARYAEPAPPERWLREMLGMREEARLVGYLGRFMPEKGMPLLLEAVARLAGSSCPPFHVAAFGGSDYRRQYQRWIDERSLGRYVTLFDFVPDVRPVLRQLSLVVVPSLWEASPLVPLEAMCAGVPVLGSDCQGLREALRGTPSKTFPAGDVEALTQALREAVGRPWADEARAFAPEARARFDNGPAAGRLLDIYGRLCKEARR
jgi:glycosyltransferase involved in cell wall biosynthesis